MRNIFLKIKEANNLIIIKNNKFMFRTNCIYDNNL